MEASVIEKEKLQAAKRQRERQKEREKIKSILLSTACKILDKILKIVFSPLASLTLKYHSYVHAQTIQFLILTMIFRQRHVKFRAN